VIYARTSDHIRYYKIAWFKTSVAWRCRWVALSSLLGWNNSTTLAGQPPYCQGHAVCHLVTQNSGLRSWLWSASNCCRRISCTWYWASRTFSWGHQHMVSTVLSATQEIQVVGTATVRSWDPCLFNLVTHISHLGDWKSGGENLQIKKSAQVILRPPVPKINHRLRQSHTIIQDLHDAHSTFLQTSVVMHPFPLSTTFPPCVVLRIPA